MVPILVLLLGSASLLAGLYPRFRFVGLVGVFTAALAFLTLLVLGLRPLPASNIISNWGPAELFGRPLAFRIDGLAWLMSVAISVTTLAVFLTGLARGGGRRLAARGASLLITAAALSAIFSADLVTLAVAWGLLDLLYFLALIGLAGSDERQAVLSLAFNSASTLLVVAAAIRATATGGGLVFGDTAFGSRTTLVLVLAAAFRLGLFPLHLALPVEANVRQGLGAVLKGLPLAYNSDLQEDKPYVFASREELDLCLEAMTAMVEALVFDGGAGRAAAEGGYAQATDVADYLVAKGLPFRNAHRIAGRLVAMLAAEDRALSEANLDELRSLSPLFGDDYYSVVDLDRVVAAKVSPGGTAPARVGEQLAAAQAIMGRLNV